MKDEEGASTISTPGLGRGKSFALYLAAARAFALCMFLINRLVQSHAS
jgi:hypothetical protein